MKQYDLEVVETLVDDYTGQQVTDGWTIIRNNDGQERHVSEITAGAFNVLAEALGSRETAYRSAVAKLQTMLDQELQQAEEDQASALLLAQQADVILDNPPGGSAATTTFDAEWLEHDDKERPHVVQARISPERDVLVGGSRAVPSDLESTGRRAAGVADNEHAEAAARPDVASAARGRESALPTEPKYGSSSFWQPAEVVERVSEYTVPGTGQTLYPVGTRVMFMVEDGEWFDGLTGEIIAHRDDSVFAYDVRLNSVDRNTIAAIASEVVRLPELV